MEELLLVFTTKTAICVGGRGGKASHFQNLGNSQLQISAIYILHSLVSWAGVAQSI
jgi:phosphosulfolactate phosphohydrolase-like enzyme